MAMETSVFHLKTANKNVVSGKVLRTHMQSAVRRALEVEAILWGGSLED